jgi:hypothetical protein
MSRTVFQARLSRPLNVEPVTVRETVAEMIDHLKDGCFFAEVVIPAQLDVQHQDHTHRQAA